MRFTKLDCLNKSHWIKEGKRYLDSKYGFDNLISDLEYGTSPIQNNLNCFPVVLMNRNSQHYWNPWTGSFSSFTSNCGMLAINSPSVAGQFDAEFYKLILDLVEAYAFHTMNRSVLVGSDRIDLSASPYQFIKKYGVGWEFSTPTHNRNYPGESGRKIGLYWKNIGEFSYSNYGVFSRA